MNATLPPKILVIDDETVIRQSFTDHLEDLGYQILTAENGRIGLEIMEQEQPDLILTDLRMPEVDGLGVIEHTRKSMPNMPIIVVSGVGRIADAIEALRLGAWDYILKPVKEMSVLAHQIEKALEKAQLLRENRMYQENLELMVHKRTNELKESKERTEQILNAIQSGVLVIDAKTYKIIEANPAALTMLEAQEEDVIGHFFREFVCPTEEHYPILEKGQKTATSECVLLTKTGKKKHIIKTIVTALLNGRETLLESFTDITERVETEVLLQKSEIHYHAIINIQTDLLYRYSLEGKVTFANKAFCQFFGIKFDEVLGRNRLDFIPPEVHKTILDLTNSLSAEQPILINENNNIDSQGKSHWFHWTNQAILNDAGEIIEYQSVARDITERKEAERKLKLQSTALQAAANAIVITDAKGEIQWVNPAFTTLTGYFREEALGANHNILSSNQQDEVFYKNLWDTISSGKVWRNKIVNKRKNGELYTEEMTITPLLSDEGEINNFIAIKQDITQQDRMQLLQNILYRISQAANRAHTPEELYPTIHRIIQEVMFANNFYIALYNEEKTLIHTVYFVDEKDSPPPPLPIGRGLTSYVLQTSQPLLCPAEKYDYLVKQNEIDTVGTRPAIWLGVPLISAGKAIGVMAVQNYEDDKTYTKEDQEFLELVSTPIANIILRQLAQAETQAYAQINALLFNAAQEISETLDLSTLYRTLYEIISEIIECDLMIVSSYNAEEELIYCAHLIMDGKNQDISEFPPLALNSDQQGTQSVVIRTGKPVIIDDYLAEMQTSKKTYYIDTKGNLKNPTERPKEEENLTRSALIVPLNLEGKVIGVVQVMSYKLNAYSESDLRILEALSSHIAVASNNANLYEQAQAEIIRRTEAENELHTLNLALEERVTQRTLELNQRVKTVEELNLGMHNLLNDLNAANAIAEKNAEELKQANTELEAFSYSVSHDLRAPLRHIESFSRLLNNQLEGTLDEKSSRYIKAILDSTERMRTLIEDLLALSRTGRVDLHIKALDHNLIIESVRAQLLDEVSERKIAWRVAPLPLAQADAGLMRILWENLIENAVKYTRPRTKTIIEIGVLPSKKIPVFFIRDNGVGFAPEYHEQLFNVFQRLHKSEDFEGSGVGLATVKRIIKRHGGKIWAESKPDEGATFYFSLGEANEQVRKP